MVCMPQPTDTMLPARHKRTGYQPATKPPAHQKLGGLLFLDRKDRQAVEVIDLKPVAFPGLRKHKAPQTEHTEIVSVILSEDVIEEASEPVSIHLLTGDLQVNALSIDTIDEPKHEPIPLAWLQPSPTMDNSIG
ncbi:hypothetical protein WR25_15563 [Diploscapter pachys]|uniref:Uncharacterized protein n=1 Tax=Diploscapter pachys TaxID=2018661 RepID=A0A2A2JVU6_9BILA|nr:hypothetical protein WR25_15563 [Diploscapter pachys]